VTPLVERLRAILGSGDHSWQEVEKRIRIFQPERRETRAAHFSLVAAETPREDCRAENETALRFFSSCSIL